MAANFEISIWDLAHLPISKLFSKINFRCAHVASWFSTKYAIPTKGCLSSFSTCCHFRFLHNIHIYRRDKSIFFARYGFCILVPHFLNIWMRSGKYENVDCIHYLWTQHHQDGVSLVIAIYVICRKKALTTGLLWFFAELKTYYDLYCVYLSVFSQSLSIESSLLELDSTQLNSLKW